MFQIYKKLFNHVCEYFLHLKNLSSAIFIQKISTKITLVLMFVLYSSILMLKKVNVESVVARIYKYRHLFFFLLQLFVCVELLEANGNWTVMPMPLLLAEQSRIFYNKAIFYRYCNHFKINTLEELLNDTYFINIMCNMVNKNPTLHSKAFQLALEVCYSKRKFEEKTVQDFFSNDFLVIDYFNCNRKLIDQSTVFSAITMKKVVDYFGYSKNEVMVLSTPIFLDTHKLTESQSDFMASSKKLTGNAIPDALLKGRQYDFKIKEHYDFNKNTIFFIDSDVLLKDSGARLLLKIQQSLSGSISNRLTDELVVKYSRNLQEFIYKRVQSKVSPQSIIEDINRYIIQNEPPLNFTFPKIIPYKPSKITELVTAEEEAALLKIPLEKGHLTSVKAKKAIMGIIDTFDDARKQMIIDVTKRSIEASLPPTPQKLEDVD